MKKNIIYAVLMILFTATAVHAQDTWTRLYPPLEPGFRTGNQLAPIGPDKILLFGGFDGSQGFQTYLADTWIYTISTNTWEEKHPSFLPAGHFMVGNAWGGMASLGGDKVFLYGGSSEGFGGGWGGLSNGWTYDLSDNTWTLSTATGPEIRHHHAMASIGNNEVVLFGGQTNGNIPKNDTWIYNAVTDTWTEKFPATVPGRRNRHKMCNIGGDKVLMNGGIEEDENEYVWQFYHDTWVYDGSDNNWVLMNLGPEGGILHYHAIASLGGDKALLLFNEKSFVYDLSENTWTQSAATTNFPSWIEAGLSFAGENKAVVFGGWGIVPSETWLFTTAPIMPWCDGGNNPHKVYICHNGNTICVDTNAISAHLAHGDYLGQCIPSFAKQGDMEITEGIKPVLSIYQKERKENSSKPGLNIYPNPGKGDFIVSLNLTDDNDGNGMIHVINSYGQVVKRININAQSKLNINLTESGIYFIKLITTKQVVTKKLVVVH